MKIYLDYIFIENFSITIITLYQMKKLLDVNTNLKRIIMSSLISSIYVVLMIFLKINFMNYLISKIILIQFIVYIAFNPKDIKLLIVETIKFLIINILNIGMICFLSNFINIKVNNIVQKLSIYFFIFFVGNYMIKYFCKLLKNKQNTQIYNVQMKILGRVIQYIAFLDTGNTTFCYTYNLPVIFAKLPKNIKDEDLSKLNNINIIVQTINGKQEKKGYLIEELFIKEINEVKKVIVIFVEDSIFDNSKYNMILNKKII